MAETETTEKAPVNEETGEGTAKRTAGKQATKKTVKKKTAKKAGKKASTATIRSVPNDNARKVAKASGGVLNVDQVRILRVLAKSMRRELTKDDLKVAVGIGKDKKYSGSWLTSLWNLYHAGLIRINEMEPQANNRSTHWHSITDKGSDVLKKAEVSSE